MAQHDYNIANASFPTVRTDLNNVLSAVNSTNSGSSRPSSAVAGTIWLDTSGAATAQLLKLYDGADDILLGTINFTANTIDWSDSSVTIADNSVTLAKMASGTDGNLISYDASGDPVAIATGSSGQVLVSAGAGAVPSFQTFSTNATHTGEVTGATALTIADNVVDEANLKVSNAPTNGYFLSAQSGNTGGMTWVEVPAADFSAVGEHLLPSADDTYNLGSATKQWANIYTGDLHLSNESKAEGNIVDGTTGNWTIQEGSEELYILNNKSVKKYKFNLTEV